jgi:hypothetical protein
MRWLLLHVVMLMMIGTVARAADFPYAVYVNSDDVYVRSGPGKNYYPTGKLRKGQKLDVYRHDPGGWLAIRPPRDSFAWVSKRHLDPDSDRLATVNSDRAVARVGSTLSDVRDVIQVRLEKGEKVELLAPPTEDSPWCKIAPPSGEFRWVFAKFVDHDLPSDLARDERDADSGRRAGVRLASADEDEGRDTDEEAAAEEAAAPRSAASRLQAAKEMATSRDAALASTTSIDRDLKQVDFELSATVAGDVGGWSFDEPKRRAEALLQQAQTPADRGAARLLLTKIERFEDIKRRHTALRSGSATVDRSAVERSPGVAGYDARRTDSARFDGVGRLAPVISEKSGGPQFALVDNSNAVISFITPAPGVNLRLYVDHYVGVNGQRGYMTDLQKQHINVQRVTVLDGQSPR